MRSKKKISKRSYKKRTNKKGKKRITRKQKGGIKCLMVDNSSKSTPPPKSSKETFNLHEKIKKATVLMVCTNRANDVYKKYIKLYNNNAEKNGWTKIPDGPDKDDKILVMDKINGDTPNRLKKKEGTDIDGIFPTALTTHLKGDLENKKFDIICFWVCPHISTKMGFGDKKTNWDGSQDEKELKDNIKKLLKKNGYVSLITGSVSVKNKALFEDDDYTELTSIDIDSFKDAMRIFQYTEKSNN